MENRGSRADGVRAEDLLAEGTEYRSGELWDGAFVVHDPVGGWSGVVGGRLHALLSTHVEERGLGWTPSAEQGYWLSRDPDRVLAPDVSFVPRARLPAFPRRGFIPFAPDFAVEVRSPWDSWAGTLAKCGIWASHGVPVVWAVDPERRTVVVFRGLAPPEEAGPGDEVDASPSLPEFRVAVARLFDGLEEGRSDEGGPAPG